MKLKLKNKITFAMGDLSYSLVYIFLNAFILSFLTEVVKMSTSVAGILVLLANVFDAVSDPIVGFLSDRKKNKGGKYSVWIKIFAIPAALCFILCFFGGNVSEKKSVVVYYFVIYLLWTVVKTCVQVPFSAMSAAITGDSMERVSLGAIRDWMSNIGGIIISVGAVWFVGYFGTANYIGYRYSALMIGIVSIIGYFIAAFKSKEQFFIGEIQLEKTKKMNADKKNYSIISSIIAIFTSKYAMALIGFVFTGQLAMGIRQSLMTYYCIYYLEDTSLSVMSVTMVLSYAIPIFGIPLVPVLIKKFGRRTIMFLGGICFAASGALSLIAQMNYIIADFSGVFIGVGICFTMSIAWGAMPDIADSIYIKSGIPAAGVLTAFITLGMAAGTGVCGFLASVVLKCVGYDSAADGQPVGVGMGIFRFFGILPIVFGCLMLICALLFDLKSNYLLDEAGVKEGHEIKECQ